MRVRLAVLAATMVTLASAAPAAAQNACDPTQTPPEFLGGVPTLSRWSHAGGENGELTTDQAMLYVSVDAAATRDHRREDQRSQEDASCAVHRRPPDRLKRASC